MGRSSQFRNLKRLLVSALFAESRGLETKEALGILRERSEREITRRQLLKGGGVIAAAAFTGPFAGPMKRAFAAAPSSVSVGIVGAGLAGLTCAYELKKSGIAATTYDAASRAGGRCHSLRGFFPGQVAERGGELIDNLHKTVLSYAQEFDLRLEDMTKVAGETTYFFAGRHRTEAEIVEEFRQFVPVMKEDLRLLSAEPSAASHTTHDARMDRVSLAEYLDGRNARGIAAGPLTKEAIIQAYVAEYGLAAGEQSCLGFLFFIHADNRSEFTPFGVFSDERFHIVEGNDRIVTELEKRLSSPVQTGHRLARVSKTSGGRIELTFNVGSRTLTKVHDAVVLSLPFSVLRSVTLDASLSIPAAQAAAIANLGYGTNAKMMIGFDGRPWAEQGGSGSSYSDLANHQTTWETNPTLATPTRAILTDFSGAERGARLRTTAVQSEADRFLTDLDKVHPGAKARARRGSAGYLVHLEHWPSNPLSRGSYTAYRPGQFTTIAGLEGKSVGNLLFAGEHTNSFYEWQGFMEGACLSGLAAAAGILAKVKRA